MMLRKLNCASCLLQEEKPKDCSTVCIHDAFLRMKSLIMDATQQVLTVIQRKIPDPPIQLVHSRDVCQYVGIESKTLYRHEKKGMITSVKRDRTGKYFLHDDMVMFKKKYHGIV